MKIVSVSHLKIMAGETIPRLVIYGEGFERKVKYPKIVQVIRKTTGSGGNITTEEKPVEIDDKNNPEIHLPYFFTNIPKSTFEESKFVSPAVIEVANFSVPRNCPAGNYIVSVINPDGQSASFQIEVASADENKILCKKCKAEMGKPNPDEWLSHLCPRCGWHQQRKVVEV